MRVNIPTIGTEWVLAEEWTFTLHPEYRNATLYALLGLMMPPWPEFGTRPTEQVTFPKGTTLVVDRIYIRKGSADFNSLSFMLKGKATERTTGTYTPHMIDEVTGEMVKCLPVTYTIPRKPVRFWAKLEDVNRMEVEWTRKNSLDA